MAPPNTRRTSLENNHTAATTNKSVPSMLDKPAPKPRWLNNAASPNPAARPAKGPRNRERGCCGAVAGGVEDGAGLGAVAVLLVLELLLELVPEGAGAMRLL